MSEALDRDCPGCGSGTGARAVVPYRPEPNDAQRDTEWIDDLPELQGIACTDCGYVLGVIDCRDPDDLPDLDRDASDYRIDGELS